MRRILAAAAAIVLFSSPIGVVAQGGAKLTFMTPKDGVTVAGPKVLVRVQVDGFSLVGAGSPVSDGEGHLHLFIDRDAAGADQTIPADQPNIVHLGREPFDEREIELGDGQHTLVAELANSSHKTFAQPATAKVTFRVAPGFRGRGPLEPACAEVATGSGEVRLVFPTEGGSLQGLIESNCGFKTEGGACSWEAVSRRRIDGTYDARARTLNGNASGTSERKLTSGPRDRCGRDETSNIPAEPFTASFTGDAATGALGQARFTVRSDAGVTLAATPGPAPSVRPAGTAVPKKTGSSFPIIPVVVGLVVVIGAALVLRSRRGRPTLPVAQPVSRPAPPPPVSAPPEPSPPVSAPPEPSLPVYAPPAPQPQPRQQEPVAPPRPPIPTAPTQPPPAQEEEELLFCSNCGAERKGSRFCTKCGAPL